MVFLLREKEKQWRPRSLSQKAGSGQDHHCLLTEYSVEVGMKIRIPLGNPKKIRKSAQLKYVRGRPILGMLDQNGVIYMYFDQYPFWRWLLYKLYIFVVWLDLIKVLNIFCSVLFHHQITKSPPPSSITLKIFQVEPIELICHYVRLTAPNYYTHLILETLINRTRVYSFLNIVDPGQLASGKSADQNPHCCSPYL